MRPFVFPVACYTVCYTIQSCILVFLQTLFRLVTQSLKKDCVTSPKSVSIGACIQSHYYLILFCWKQHIASKRNTVSRKPFKCALTGWVHVHMLIAGRFTMFFFWQEDAEQYNAYTISIALMYKSFGCIADLCSGRYFLTSTNFLLLTMSNV